MSILRTVGPKCTLAASSHGEYTYGTDRPADRHTGVTLRFPLWTAY